METKPQSPQEIINRFRMASRLATAMESFAKRQRMDVLDVLEAANDNTTWRTFAALAGCSSGYTPSPETRLIVAELIRHGAQKACMDCGLRQGWWRATQAAHKGHELCTSCWERRFGVLPARAEG